MELIDVLKKLVDMHGTTLEEEVAKYNADIEQRIASGYMHPIVSAEERVARTKAVIGANSRSPASFSRAPAERSADAIAL